MNFVEEVLYPLYFGDMKMKYVKFVWLCILLVVSFAQCTMESDLPDVDAQHQEQVEDAVAVREVVEKVYKLKQNTSRTDWDSLNEADFSKELWQIIDTARNAQRAQLSLDLVDMKPFIIEGEVFASLQEGYTYFDIGTITIVNENEYKVAVHFSFAFDETEPEETWVDQVIVVREDGRWRIDNVVYAEKRLYPKDIRSLLKNYYKFLLVREE